MINQSTSVKTGSKGYLLLGAMILAMLQVGCAGPEKLAWQATQAFEQGDCTKATQRWLKAVRKDPSIIEAYFGLSLCAEKDGDYDTALAYANKAIDYSRHNPAAWYHHRAYTTPYPKGRVPISLNASIISTEPFVIMRAISPLFLTEPLSIMR